MSDANLDARIARAIAAPATTNARARTAIMDAVRRAAREGAPSRMLPPGLSRGARHSIAGLALAAGIGSITTLSAIVPAATARHAPGASSVVTGDSVVNRLRDTLRLVRMMFDDSAARHVAVIGDFNRWRPGANAMQRDAQTGRWAVTLALHDGAHRYAIVVDNTRRNGVLHVSRAAN